MAPAEIIGAITAPDFDADAALRQYAVVDLEGRTAAFTGAENGLFAADQQGSVDGLVYSVQGNLLTGPRVLDRARAGFEAPACDLPERLMAALVAGAEDGEGDRRCAVDGIPADSAFLRVEQAGDVIVHLSVVDTGPESAVEALRRELDVWRAAHPCSVIDPDAGPSEDAGTSPDAGPGSPERASCGCHAAGAGAELPLSLVIAWSLVLWRTSRRRRHGTAGPAHGSCVVPRRRSRRLAARRTPRMLDADR